MSQPLGERQETFAVVAIRDLVPPPILSLTKAQCEDLMRGRVSQAELASQLVPHRDMSGSR